LRPGDTVLHVWKEDPKLSAGKGPFRFLNGIAIDQGSTIYASTVLAAPYLLRVQIQPDGTAGPVTRIAMPRPLENADAIRSDGLGRLLIFESDAFGHDGAYGGMITLARVKGDRAISLTPIVAGLNNPSSGVIVGNRVYFIQSKYPLLVDHK